MEESGTGFIKPPVLQNQEGKERAIGLELELSGLRLTHLEGILQMESCLVDSLHNQAVDLPGPDILVAARDLAGVVQAVEHKTYPFALGVQWHPEYLPQVKSQQRIFGKLVRLAASHKENEME